MASLRWKVPTLFAVLLLSIGQASTPIPPQTANRSASASREKQNKPNNTATSNSNSSLPLNAESGKDHSAARGEERNDDAEQLVRIREFPPVSVTKDWADWGVWAFSALLVVVGFLQVVLLGGTLKVIQRQAREMERQTTVAKASADAALLGAKAVMAAERPWLLVSITEAEYTTPGSPVPYIVQAFNAGRTPAVLDEGHCAIEKHPVEFAEPLKDFQEPFPLPMQNLIVSRDSFEMRRFTPEKQLTQDERTGIEPQMIFVYGRVYYWDVFADRSSPGAKPYVTQWLFRYDSTTRSFHRCAGRYAQNT